MSGGVSPYLKTESLGVDEEIEFLASEHYMVKRVGVTLAADAVPADANGDKIVPKGTLITPRDSDGLYVPHTGVSDEVQTLTVGGAGLTSFTLTFNGQTTGAIDADASAEQAEAALTSLSNIGDGDVTVTGDDGGPWRVEFGGALADTNVAALTSTPTGGTGTVTVATPTAGGAAGTPVLDPDESGYTRVAYNLRDGDVGGGIVIHGSVLAARVHPAPDATIRAALRGRIIFQ